jgi:8-oxo-dGTP diphosphatase
MKEHGVRRIAYRTALGGFRRLPAAVRRTLVHWGAPSYTVGAVCAIVRDDTVLLLRQRHRDGWTLPGGLLDRREDCDAAVRRELREELRLDVDPGLPVTALVVPRARRVDVIYRWAADADTDPQPRGEATSSAWLRPGELADDSAGTAEILARLLQARGGRL